MKAVDQITSKNKSVEFFRRRYYARIKPGSMECRTEPILYTDWAKDHNAYYNHSTHQVQTFDINIAEDEFSKLLNELSELETEEYHIYVRCKKLFGDSFISDISDQKHKESRESSIRSRNPGVQKAWENYQLMLKLAGG